MLFSIQLLGEKIEDDEAMEGLSVGSDYYYLSFVSPFVRILLIS